MNTTGKDDVLLEKMIELMIKATERAERAVDETLASVDASNRRIERMEEQAQRFRDRH